MRDKGQEWVTLLWSENLDLRSALQAAEHVEAARDAIQTYLHTQERAILGTGFDPSAEADLGLAMQALSVAKSVFSQNGEEACGFSTLDTLWRLARGATDGIHWGFVAETVHLFRAIERRAHYGRGWLGGLREVMDFTGRHGAIQRSAFLDSLFEKVRGYLNRYPTSLQEPVRTRRKANIRKILDHFGGTEKDWYDWHWQYKHVLRGPEGVKHLRELAVLSEEEQEACELAARNEIPFGVTPYYVSLFDLDSAERKYDEPVRAQVLPPLYYVQRMSEHRDDRGTTFDFMGEHDTSPKELITRRYPMVAIVKPYDSCPQICVYCQRNWEITGPFEPGARPARKTLEEALEWLERRPAVVDVLVTGGDPMVLSDREIRHILERLFASGHTMLVRIASRVPVTVPMRITDDTARMLGSFVEPGKRSVCFVTHLESSLEVTEELVEAVTRLRKNGIYVYNQLVYTARVSRRFENVAARIAMKRAGIDPYYTFYPKGKDEHKGYTIPLARLLQERKEEARLLPGQFRTDEPVFNVPRLGKNHVRAFQDRRLVGIDREGRRVYVWHPWEKGISRAKPYVYTDVSIAEYLEYLERRGEDPQDYATIWYYY